MSHRDREHPPGAVERGNDWLDGALAGWLLFIAIQTIVFAWSALRGGDGAAKVAYELAPALLALAAIVPLLRFHRIGWILAALCLGLMAVREGMRLADTTSGWKAAAAFLLVHLAGLAYLVWIIPEFWPRVHPEEEPAVAPPEKTRVARGSTEAAESTDSAKTAEAAEPAAPTPVTQALASLHHRIVAAGSACALAPDAVRAEAGRFGVTPALLRTEGLALYRTFLQHFLADGSLSPDEERELICLERALDLDDDGVWRLRAEAGLVGGPGSPAAVRQAALAPGAEQDADALSSGAADGDGAALPVSVDAARDHGEAPVSATDADEAPLPLTGDAERDDDEPPPPHAAEAPFDPDIHDHDIHDHLPQGFEPEMETPRGEEDGLADYEEHELGALLAWAGVPALPAGTAPRTALERLRALHRASTEPLDECTPDQPLEPGERCLAIRNVQLYRAPAAAQGAPADLPAPVLDPLSLLDGSPELERDLSTFQRTGVCRFLLTDRRLLLVAPSGQQSPLPVSRVRTVRPFRNGLEVHPHRGSPVFLAFSDDVLDAAMRIDRAARGAHAGG